MSSSFEQRAALRCSLWQGGKLTHGSELEEEELQFWAQASGSQRLNAVWQMALESAIIKGDDRFTSRLQRSVAGLRSSQS